MLLDCHAGAALIFPVPSVDPCMAGHPALLPLSAACLLQHRARTSPSSPFLPGASLALLLLPALSWKQLWAQQDGYDQPSHGG